jgi:ATP-binding cassette subfamily B protein
MNKTIDFGVIVAFMMYIRFFTRPLMQIAQSFTGIQSATAASERVFDFLEQKEMDNEKDLTDKLDIKDVSGNLEFRDVHFGYDIDKEIIHGFTAKAKSGQKIAIVGPTGAGKTTIVNLLMKFYPINSGDILIDGKSINKITRENVHDLFTMVLQDTWIFEGSIKDNIKYSNKEATDEEVIEACKKVGLHHLIKTLPKGYDTILTDSDNLSAGEKQLLTIARAMISKKPYLILDEATSNVDTRTEELVQSAMDKLAKGRTSFIIAHRLSTIRNADLILVMNNGKIIEQGTHDELLEKNGFYAELYNSQFQELLD